MLELLVVTFATKEIKHICWIVKLVSVLGK